MGGFVLFFLLLPTIVNEDSAVPRTTSVSTALVMLLFTATYLNPLVKLFDDSDEVESIRRGKMEDSSTDRVKFSTGSGSGHAIVDGDSLRTIEVDDEEYVVGEEGYVERKKITS